MNRRTIHPQRDHRPALVALAFLSALLLAGGAAGVRLPAVHGQGEVLKKRQPGAKPAFVQPPTSGAKQAGASSTGGVKAAPGAATAAPKPGETAAGQEPDARLLQRIVGFIRGYAVWILAALGAGFLVTILVTVLGRRKSSGPVESPFAELGLAEPAPKSRKFSSTKIAASDVIDRLGVKTTEVETDREYALVVDEEALKMPPLPEDESAPSYDPEGIRKRLADKDLEGAYKEYAGVIDADPGAAVDPEVERSLGEELLRARQLDKAARVLEHHVATHRARGIPPECYFNLGYVYFLRKTYKKSTRFFKLFVMAGKNPAHVERAKKILEQIEKSGNLN
jgi:hypothetical protein